MEFFENDGGMKEKKPETAKKVLNAVLILLLLWAAIGLADYMRIRNFDRPLFCAEVQAKELDGRLVGAGYSVEYETGEGDKAFSHYVYRVFGMKADERFDG